MSRGRRNQVSDRAPTVKRAGGLVAGTPVMTLDGVLPVEYLTPGDRILTRSGARELKTVSVRVDQSVAVVRIGAGTLGHNRPTSETLVPMHQMILIRDWRAQALYGAAQALVAAGRLADGRFIWAETMDEARIFILGFDEDVVIYADELEMACLREVVSA